MLDGSRRFQFDKPGNQSAESVFASEFLHPQNGPDPEQPGLPPYKGAVYSLDVGIVGTTGVLTIDDTHRDIVLAVSKPQQEGYNPDASRLVDFMGSYPPGDVALGELRGPMADETVSWLSRVATMTRAVGGRLSSCLAYFLLAQRSNSRIKVAEMPRSWPWSRKYSERL